jgi:serine/threonine protein kinase
MRRLYFNLLLLALPIGIFLAWFEIARGNRETNLFVVKRNLLAAAAARVEIVCLGPSHAHEGIAPLLVHSNAFNLSAVSQSLYYDCALVEKYAPTLPRLRLVVLPISYLSMDYELDRSTEEWRAYYYRHFHGIAHRDWRQESVLRNWSSWFLYGRDFGISSVRGTLPPVIRSGYDDAGGVVDTRPPDQRTAHPKPDHVRTSAPTAIDRHHACMYPEFLPVNEARLRELLVFLRSRGIGAVFVTLPTSDGYRALEREETRSRTAAALARLKHDFGVEWRDFSADPRFVEDDFWDADHLNFTGAAKFSRILGVEVVQPALNRSPAR